MLDLTKSYISEAFVHRIGNKARNEDILISNTPIAISDSLEKVFFKLFFSAFDNKTDLYEFYHEEGVELNEAYAYINSFVRENDSFIEASTKLAKLLYRVTTHPNIHSGELIVADIKNVILNGKKFDVVGVFKSEEKDSIIKIEEVESSLSANLVTGINPKNLDKGALIFYSDSSELKVQIYNKKSFDSVFWNNNFLGCIPYQDDRLKTQLTIDACLKFQNKLAKSSKSKTELMNINNSLFEYFNEADSFTVDSYSNGIGLTQSETEEFIHHIKAYEKETNINLSNEFKLDEQNKKIIQKRLANVLKLDDSIEIKISLACETPSKIIEKGYDEEKKMSFYKIYYSSEN